MVKRYEDEFLLSEIKRFYKIHGRVPSRKDFSKNGDFPSSASYYNHFKGWEDAIRLCGYEVNNTKSKGRMAESIIFNSFRNKEEAIDLSGNNWNSELDGICPKGHSYDVKSGSLFKNVYQDCWQFRIDNKNKDKIDYYFLVGFDKKFIDVMKVWMIPSNIVNSTTLYIGNTPRSLLKMKKYEIDSGKCIIQR